MSVDLLVFVLAGVPGTVAATAATVGWIRLRRRGVGDGRSGWTRFWDDVFGSESRGPAPASDTPPHQEADPDRGAAEHPDDHDATMEIASDPRIPVKSREKAAALLGSIEIVKGRMDGRSATDPLVVEVEAMRTRHLQEALRHYVEIPEEHRAEFFRKTGRSASFHLAETIDVMAKRLDEISRALAQEKLDRFANSNRFIGGQYGADDSFRID